jgi:hypothetical protein
MAGTPPVGVLLDNANRADSGTLGANWTMLSGNLEISSNQFRRATSGVFRQGGVWNVTSFAADQEAYVTVAAVDTVSAVELLVRSSTTTARYGLNVDVNTGGWGFSYLGASFGSGGTQAIQAGDRIVYRVVGSVHQAWHIRAGVATLVMSATESSYTSSGNIGLRMASTGAARADDFGGGEVYTISATRQLQYGLAGRVSATRQLQWGVVGRMSATRQLLWNVTGSSPEAQFMIPTFFGVAFGYDPYDPAPVYTDLTDRLISWSFERGRRTTFDTVDPARLTAKLYNGDRALDPSYASSPYAGEIEPGVRVVLELDGERVYSGFAEAWPQDWNDLRNDVNLTALDIFDTFNVDMIPGTVYAVQKSGARITAGLTEIGVPSAWYTGLIGTGIDDVQAHTAGEEDNWLEHFKQVATTEQGYLFQDREGNVRFYQRHALSLSPFTDIQVTVANFPGGGEWMLTDVDDPDYSVRNIKNDVRVTRKGGATTRAFDAASRAKHRARTHQVTTLHESTTTPQDLATWILGLYKDPKLRPDGVTLEPQSMPGMLHPIIERDLADRVRMRVQPPGPTGLIDVELAIQSIGMSMGEDRRLVVKWNLAPPTGASQTWRLGTDLLGVTTYLGF